MIERKRSYLIMTKLPYRFPFARPMFPLTLSAATDLIKYHCDSGRLSDARKLFDELPNRDVVAWTAMICGYASNAQPDDAWAIFRNMAASPVSPNAFTLSSVLTACKEMQSAERTASVHSIAIHRGINGWVHVDNALIDAYSASAGMDDAFKVFDGISQRSAASWTTIIAACVRHGHSNAAVQMCLQMFRHEGAELNPFTLSIAIRASAAVGSLELGRQIHAAAIKTVCDFNLPVSNSIIDMYSRCMSFSEARYFFYEMPLKDLITWNTMISCLAHEGSLDSCFLLLSMFSQSIQPNAFTFTSIISSCAKLSTLSFGQQVHGSVLQRGFGENRKLANALTNMYAKCGGIAESRKVFNEMHHRDLVSWTAMINGYGVHGYGKEAIELFDKMTGCGIQPDSVLLLGVLNACSHAGLVEEGLKYFRLMESQFSVSPDMEMYGCIVDLLGRSGRLREASMLISKMPFEPDESIWGALLGACKMHNNIELGRIVAWKILEMKPDGAKTYVILSNIYASGSEWDWFANTRKLMKTVDGKKEVGMSWIAVRDEVCSFVSGDRSNPCVLLSSHVLEILVCHMDRKTVGGVMQDL